MAQQRPMPARGAGPSRAPIGFQKPKDLRGTISRILGYMNRNRAQVFGLVVMLLLNTGSSLVWAYFLKPLINRYIIPGDFRGLAFALAELGGVFLVGVLSAYGQMRLNVQLSQRTVNTMRRDLFDRMQDLELKYFDTHTHGELMSRFTNDFDNVQMMLEQSLVQFLSSALTLVGCIVMMLLLSPLLFVMIALVMALMVFVSTKITGKSRFYFKKQQRVLGELDGYIEENIGGLREVKVFNREEAEKTAFNRLNEEFRSAASGANFLAGVVMPVMGNLNNIAYTVTAVAGSLMTLAGRFDIGSLAAFLQYSRQMGQPINMITSQFNNVLAALAGAERIFDMMDQPPEKDGGRTTLARVDNADEWVWKKSDGETVPLRGDVRFHNVDFAYEPGKPVLHQVSLYAKPGQVIAFVGSTGAGKTTITNLINRFYDVQTGSITYDGIDVRDIRKESLRRSLGVVLQDTHLFTGTVLDNIRYGRLDASDEECIEAARQASAHSFISRLPEGYHTVISGDGANLSQGQRQLLAIARAYVADPPVMILDEATSSIDTRTERLVERGVQALMRGRTVFIIAHRLSTVRHANAIIVLEHGRIIERGNHEQLLAQKGRYYQLYTGKNQLE